MFASAERMEGVGRRPRRFASAFVVFAVVLSFAAFAQQRPPSSQSSFRNGGGGRFQTGFSRGPSETYYKNLQHGHGDGGVGRAYERVYDRSHYEEERARRIRDAERNQQQMQSDVRANKRQIEANRAAAESAARAREREQSEEIRRRAAEQERTRLERQDRAAAKYDAIMSSLKPCRAFNSDGSPCRRKANPGLDFCHLHVGYSGELQPIPGKVPSPKPVAPSPVVTQTVVVSASPASSPLPLTHSNTRTLEHSNTSPVSNTQTLEHSNTSSSSFDHTLVLLTLALAALVALVAVGGFVMVALRRRGE